MDMSVQWGLASGRALWLGPHGPEESPAWTISHRGRLWDRHHTFQFDVSLVPQATYLSPRPERALGKAPLEQPPQLKGPGSWARDPSVLVLHAVPTAKRGYGFRNRADLGLKNC